MCDKMITTNVLSLLKGEVDLHIHATVEAGCPEIRKALEKSLADVLCMQNEVYQAMNKKGWYSPMQVEQKWIEDVKTKYPKL